MQAATPDTIRVLVRQAARWATAAQQDQNLVVAVFHASYAVAYVTALRQVANDADIKAATGVDAVAIDDEIAKIQDGVTRKLVAACPGIRPPGRLAVIAGESVLGCCRPC